MHPDQDDYTVGVDRVRELQRENERLRELADWWADKHYETAKRAECAEARLADADRVMEAARLCAEIGGPGTRVGALGRDALNRLREALDPYDREEE